jgi:aquaporin Z
MHQCDRSMSSPGFQITALSSSASLGEAVRTHWREYLTEFSGTGALMFCICLFGTILYSNTSPMARFALSRAENAAIMGVGVAGATLLIVRSPFGRRSGAHFNPAISLTYLWLGRMHRWDALSYVAAHFSGALCGVFLARQLLGLSLSSDPVHYVVTVPGSYGRAAAFIAEFLLSALLMCVVLFATNHRTLARFSPLLVAAVTVFYFAICSSISGFSVNPARTLSSAIFAWIWWGIWIYFIAPCLGMLAAAGMYIRTFGPSRIYCAKVFHDMHSTCPFPCRFAHLEHER